MVYAKSCSNFVRSLVLALEGSLFGFFLGLCSSVRSSVCALHAGSAYDAAFLVDECSFAMVASKC